MKKTLYDYAEIIKKLPLKDKYTKEELLIEDLLIDKEKNIEIYYAPHNEYINPKAKVLIVGITPGFIQMSTAIAAARKELENNTDIEEIQYKCKVAGRFSGSLRKNIISMLDEIKLNEVFNLDSCSELFAEKDYLMHTVSLIPYPVFVKKQNYTGHTPKLLKSDFLMICLHILGNDIEISTASVFFNRNNSANFDFTLTLNGDLLLRNINISPKCSFLLISINFTYC